MLDADLNDYLLAGEKVLWSGKPAQGIAFTSQDWLLIPFSLIWGGFSVFWEMNVLAQTQAPFFMKLWGVPFVLAGLYLTVGRFVLDAWVRGRTVYAVTSMRILVRRDGVFSKFTALNLDRLPDANLSVSSNGTGTIRFGQQVSMWGQGSGFSAWAPSFDPTPQFIAIDNARSVFDQIQQAARRSAMRP